MTAKGTTHPHGRQPVPYRLNQARPSPPGPPHPTHRHPIPQKPSQVRQSASHSSKEVDIQKWLYSRGRHPRGGQTDGWGRRGGETASSRVACRRIPIYSIASHTILSHATRGGDGDGYRRHQRMGSSNGRVRCSACWSVAKASTCREVGWANLKWNPVWDLVWDDLGCHHRVN